jgi:hypothetical protein
MRVYERESLFFSMLTFLCLEMAGPALATDEPARIAEGDLTVQLEYWPAHCTELERSRGKIDASRCWWFAAEELTRVANAGGSFTDELKELRRDWLWNGVRLSLQHPDPESPPAPEPSETSRLSPDPAPAADPLSCKSIQVSDCRAATPAATEVEPVPLRKKKKASANKKKAVRAETAKAKTEPVVREARKKVVKPAAPRATEAALPVVPGVQRKSNIACPPTKPCIGRQTPAALLR